MATLRTLLIDDQPLYLDRLDRLIKHYCPQTIQIIDHCQTLQEALNAIEAQRPDLIFLDVELDEGQSGFELLSQVTLIDFDVIFCTSHMEYAFQAFRADAVDYLLKPVDSDQLVKAINKVLARSPRERAEHLEQLTEVTTSEVRKVSRIGIPNTTGRYFIDLIDIYYCEAANKGTDFYGPRNENLTGIYKKGWLGSTSESLISFAKALQNSNFYQIHESCLINMAHVKAYRSVKRGGTVTMKDGTELSVSGGRRGGFLETVKGGID